METVTRVSLPGTSACLAAIGVVQRLRAQQHAAFLVGGCVRDMLLGLSPKDFDVATSAHPDAVRALFAHVIEVGAAFGVLRVHVRGPTGAVHEVEVATFRAEANYADGRRPTEVRFTEAREDVRRRDFTVNGLLCDPLDTTTAGAMVVDWVGGLADLDARVLRAIGEPRERFGEDALRLLRAPRFAARFGLALDPATEAAIVALAPTLARVSAERVRGELAAMWSAATAGAALRWIAHLQLGAVLWPELAAAGGEGLAAARLDAARALWSARPAAQGGATGLDLPLALAIVHWPLRQHWPARRWEAALKLSRQEVKRTGAIWQLAAAMLELPLPQLADPPPAWLRLLRAPDADAALVLLAAAGHAALALPLLALRDRSGPQAWSPPLHVTGDTLLELGHRPGPAFRAALIAAEDAQLAGANPEVALAAALERLQQR